MNRSANRSIRRSNRKKAVPLYFQKSCSNSQFLAAANYKLKIKQLKKANKELACSLQDVKCRAADQEKALAECHRESTQAMYVKMKIKNIVETVQKLVTDLGEVYDVIDGKSFDFLKNCSASHQAARIPICNPSLSLVEESASMSTIEPDLSKEESLCAQNLAKSPGIDLPTANTSLFSADTSQTEIYNVPLALFSEQKNVSNENQSEVARSSKSLEQTGSSPMEPDSPQTPQPPNFLLSIESQNFIDASKLMPITSQTSVQPADLPGAQATASVTKSTAKSTISKIPVKKPASSTVNNFPLSVVPSNDMGRRKTFVVEKKVEEPQISPPVSDRRDTIVLSTLADNVKSNIISDRRGTFVINSLPDTKPDTILDRRATYFIPPGSKEQPDTSPKVIETPIPIQNVAPNHTILLCEDMELTEILPLQSQSPQFTSMLPSWNKTLEAGLNENLSTSVGNQPPCTTSLVKQFPNSNVDASINSLKQLEVATLGVGKNSHIPNTMSDNKPLDSNILPRTKVLAETLASNQDVSPPDLQQKRNEEKEVKKKMPKKEASPSNHDASLPDLQQKRNEEKEIKKKMLKKDNINTNVKCSTKELPSPIAYYAKPDMSIQHKIFESFSAINTESDKIKPTLDTASLVKEDDHKKSTASKDSLSTHQPAAEKVIAKEDAESPMPARKSARKMKKCYADYFSSSDESQIDFEVDFVPEKRFSLQPGRKIINKNNKKVFVFTKNPKKQPTDKDSPSDSSQDKLADENIKNDQEKDIFNFSSSSDAGRSPKKSKKRKSVMPKTKKCSASKQLDSKKLSKSNRRSSKPEVYKDEVFVAPLPRKSILSMNIGNSPFPLKRSSLDRKSVRFSFVENAPAGEINIHKNESPDEANMTSVNQKSDYIKDTEKVFPRNNTQDKRSSSRKRCSLARSNSLKATGDKLKSKNAKTKKSIKRQSCNLNSDSPEDFCESDCSPEKKMCQVSNETPSKKIETQAEDKFDQIISTATSEVPEETADRKKEKNSVLLTLDTDLKVAGSVNEVEKTDISNVKRPFSGVSERTSNKKLSPVGNIFSFEEHEEKLGNIKKEKNSSTIRSELPQNLDANVTVSESENEIERMNNCKAKRPFSGVSERRSDKKKSIVDDLFPSLDDAICEMVDQDMNTSFKLVENEPTQIYNVKEAIKSVETDCNKGNSVTTKTVQRKKASTTKKSSNKKKTSGQSKDKENTPNIALKNIKLDVLCNDDNFCTSKEYVEKAVKPKTSKKKKAIAPLLESNPKLDTLNAENDIESYEAGSGRSRRHKSVASYKEPSLNVKMRRG